MDSQAFFLDKCGIMKMCFSGFRRSKAPRRIPGARLYLRTDNMKRLFALAALLLLLLGGCRAHVQADIAATTLPVYEFTCRITSGSGLTVTRLVTESVSCLHDYSLNVSQVKAIEAADCVVISGAGLEEFMEDLLRDRITVDASVDIPVLECAHLHHEDHEQADHGHHHETDSHIWLSPANAAAMAKNICRGLSEQYPRHSELFSDNLAALLRDIEALEAYGAQQLQNLKTREMITFHDGFGYFAQAFDLHILEAVEEESGSEASARELIDLICIVREHNLPAIFTEINGSASAGSVIARETGAAVYSLDMAMSGESWFRAMYRNIDTIKEAMG